MKVQSPPSKSPDLLLPAKEELSVSLFRLSIISSGRLRIRIQDRKKSDRLRGLVSALFWIGLFFLFSPGSTKPVAAVEIIPVKHLFDIQKDALSPPLNQPSSVAVDPQKRIWVLDGVNSRVAGFTSKGKYLAQFGRKGSGPGEFKSPLGLAIDSQGLLYVADSKNHRIQVFNDQGTFLSEIYLPPDKYGCLSDPTDIVLDEKKKRLIIVDNDNHRLLLYSRQYEIGDRQAIDTDEHKDITGPKPDKDSSESAFICEVGGVGYKEGNFRYPYTACIDSVGNIYVTDVINTRVQVLTPDGSYIRSIGEWGIEKGQFFRPQSICMDRRGRVFVGENYDKIGLIQVFDQQGNLLGIVGDLRNQKIRFRVPSDLYVDQENRLYVVQMYTSVISVYSFVDE